MFDKNEIQIIVTHQLSAFFNYETDIVPYLEEAVYRTNQCLIKRKGKYFDDKAASPFHSGHYCIFLYWLSRVMWEMDKNGKNAEKIYYLNKALNSVDLYYEINLPSIWGCEHPLGSSMGRAIYSDHFFFYQGCTVGANYTGHPILGSDVLMYSNAKILGKCTVGNHVILSANSYVKDMDIPDNCIVFGQSPNIVIKQKSTEEIETITGSIWKHM